VYDAVWPSRLSRVSRGVDWFLEYIFAKRVDQQYLLILHGSLYVTQDVDMTFSECIFDQVATCVDHATSLVDEQTPAPITPSTLVWHGIQSTAWMIWSVSSNSGRYFEVITSENNYDVDKVMLELACGYRFGCD
jgi:hypothetical protein